MGDRYAGEWPREQFLECGIQYEPAELTKSEIYPELLPAMSVGKMELLDHSRSIAQLCSLERRSNRPPGASTAVRSVSSGFDGEFDLAYATRRRNFSL